MTVHVQTDGAVKSDLLPTCSVRLWGICWGSTSFKLIQSSIYHVWNTRQTHSTQSLHDMCFTSDPVNFHFWAMYLLNCVCCSSSCLSECCSPLETQKRVRTFQHHSPTSQEPSPWGTEEPHLHTTTQRVRWHHTGKKLSLKEFVNWRNVYPELQRCRWDTAQLRPDVSVSSLYCCSSSLLHLHSGRGLEQISQRDYCCPSYSEHIWNTQCGIHKLDMRLDTKEPLEKNGYW